MIGLGPAELLNKEAPGMYHDENGVPIPSENLLPFRTEGSLPRFRQNGPAAGTEVTVLYRRVGSMRRGNVLEHI
ncbi:MAG TPA: hypothetical protein VF482_04115, partial [Trebonia sp.]